MSFIQSLLIVSLLAAPSVHAAIDFDTAVNVLRKVKVALGKTQQSEGVRLTFNLAWKRSDFSATPSCQSRSSEDHLVFLTGGVARADYMTADTFAVIACHEAAHCFGGEPRVIRGASVRARVTVEGQSDFWAANTCLREYFGNQLVSQNFCGSDSWPAFDRGITRLCQSAYPNQVDQFICAKTIASAEGAVRGSMRKGERVDIGTPSPLVVSATDLDHPSAQCRLDTFVQAAVCPQGECLNDRPRCWYHPSSGEGP